MSVAITIPEAGESIFEAQIGTWKKSEGDRVERDEIVVEIETDKASMELSAPVSGTLERILHGPGDVVPVGEAIALVREQAAPERAAEGQTEGASFKPQLLSPPGREGAESERIGPSSRDASTEQPAQSSSSADDSQLSADRGSFRPQTTGESHEGQEDSQEPRATILQRGMESQARVTPRQPSRPLRSPSSRPEARPPEYAPAIESSPGSPRPGAEPHGSPGITPSARNERLVPLGMIRRRIAHRLVEAQRTMAMLTTFNEVDMGEVLRLRKENGQSFQERHGVKLGQMSFFVAAVVGALRHIPRLNAELRDDHLVMRDYCDIGVAVSTDQGLVVPVIRNADRLSFADVEETIADLARRARERRLAVDEMQGGTFTITNGGVFGSMMSTPIINPPQCGILGLHAIQERPVAREGQVAIRPMMYLALTYDHRVIDGKEAVTFLRNVKESIESPVKLLLEL